MTKEEANKILLDRYGLDLHGKQKFRVVWSTEETEVRVGEFEEWYGEIFVRRLSGAREWPKYSYIEDKWILEELVPSNNPELLERLSYEPIYVFQDKHGNYLPLNIDAAHAVINAILSRPEFKPRTEKQDLYEENEKKEKEKKEFKSMLKSMDSEFERRIRNQELILNPLSSEVAES